MAVTAPWPLVAAVALAVVHVTAHQVREADPLPTGLWLSVAGGVSIAYVFVHVLPELGHGQHVVGGGFGVLPFLEHHVYFVALVGFVAYYGVEVWARRQDGGDSGTGVFWAHVASFGLYNGLVGYFLVHRIDAGPRQLLLFAAAMALHFFVTDSGLDRHYDDTYRRYGRWVLAAAVLGGWGVARATEFQEVAVVTMFAFLAGGIVLNVVKEEVPDEGRSSLGGFVAGAAGYAGVLFLI